ncbi:MAG: hypothetical protein A3K19_19485 [Lentisphaerae bacterium RIFOXYB12_FULL_65_16]|nr:MAG: hypothetical protein A3K19_19485 [Lentisphaerae bacterium RIFOXYB12_FULL_65_16]
MSPEIDAEIQSCRTLLNVFQAERRAVLSGEATDARSILPFLQLKKRLLGVLDAHGKQEHAQAGQDGTAAPDSPQSRQRLRELGALLEQLLVIDGENELLLRRALGGNPAGSTDGSRFARRDGTASASPGAGMEQKKADNVHVRPARFDTVAAGGMPTRGTDPANAKFASAAQRLKFRYL